MAFIGIDAIVDRMSGILDMLLMSQYKFELYLLRNRFKPGRLMNRKRSVDSHGSSYRRNTPWFLTMTGVLLLLVVGGCADKDEETDNSQPPELSEQEVEASDSLNPQNQHIPSDAFAYFGSIKPFSVTEWKQKFPNLDGATVREMFLNSSPGKELAEDQDVSRLTQFLLDGLVKVIDDPESAIDSYGVDANALNWAFHVSGALPVLRFQLADPEKFLQALPEFEQNAEVSPETVTLDDIEIRQYQSSDDESDLALAVVGDSAVLTISTGDMEVLSNSIGLSNVADNLAETNTVSSLQRKYQYTSDMLGYLDFTKLADLLLNSENELVARFGIPGGGSEDPLELSSLTSPECKQEFTQIAESWPRIVMGYRSFDVVDDRFHATYHIAAELTHPKLLEALTSLRGHIPDSFKKDDSPFSMAFGLDAGNLGDAVSTVTSLLDGMNYQCAELSNLNEMKASNTFAGSLAMLTFSSMVDGVRGLGVKLFDIQDSSVDGVVSIATDNPGKLITLAKTLPMLRNVDLPEDGSAIRLDELIPEQALSNIPISEMQHLANSSVAQRANQLVLFGGENGTAFVQDPLESIDTNNGNFYFSADLERLSEMESSIDSNVNLDTDADMAQFRAAFPQARIGSLIEFTDNGIELETQFDFNTTTAE